MSRKEMIYEVPAAEGNRDAGKRFLIVEMPATKAEKWAMRAILALMRGNVDLPAPESTSSRLWTGKPYSPCMTSCSCAVTHCRSRTTTRCA